MNGNQPIHVSSKFIINAYKLAEVHISDNDVLGEIAEFLYDYSQQVMPNIKNITHNDEQQIA